MVSLTPMVRQSLPRTGAIIATYAIAWTLLFFVGARFQDDGFGFMVRLLAGGLDVSLLLLCGWRVWPVIPAVAALRWFILGDAFGVPLWAMVVAQAAVGLIYALSIRYLMERLDVRFPLLKLRHVAAFLGILAFAVPLVLGFIAAATIVSTGSHPHGTFAENYLRYVMGTSSGILLLVPMVTTFGSWKDTWPGGARPRHYTFDLFVGAVATVCVVIVGFAAGVVAGSPLNEFVIVPVAWMAIRFGMRGAVLGILATVVSSALLYLTLHLSPHSSIGYQSFLISTALMAIVLGAMTNERQSLMVLLEGRAYVDELTNLPNRDRLVEWIRHNRDRAVVLVMLDIDDMRLLNEGVGRLAADRVLQDFATRLRTGLPPAYFVARVSSDEFAVAIVDDRSPHALIAEIRQLFEVPFDIDGSRIFVEASAGAVRMVRVGDVDDLMRRADLALHRAKETPSRAAVYTPDLQSASVPLLVVELHRALELKEFVPFFQPIYRYDKHVAAWKLVGAEALLRWLHPQRGVIAPVDFIELLERLSIADRVGWNVMEESLRLANVWRASVPEFRVWVNLFSRQALDVNCVQRIRELISTTQSVPQALVVEINERIVVSEEREVAALAQSLRALGVTTAIDDFGTGGSSLGRVRDVPAQVLKIDRSFVTRCEIDSKAKAVAAAVVRLARELGMDVVAEGVENALQVDAMIEVGCELAQGYALGHPVPADLFERLVADSVP
jgi:diguanylate cyclase (GGDEF)-like protein